MRASDPLRSQRRNHPHPTMINDRPRHSSPGYDKSLSISTAMRPIIQQSHRWIQTKLVVQLDSLKCMRMTRAEDVGAYRLKFMQMC